MAQTTSVGQAVALAIFTRDILDPIEVNDFVGTDAYRVASGVTDALVRLFLDPDVLVSKGLGKARAAARLGAFEATVAPEIGARLRRFNIAAPRIEAVNDIIRTTFHRLPESLQNL